VSGQQSEDVVVGVAYVAVEGCACPVPDGAEWTLRYGTPEAREAQRYGVASIVSAYAHLLDPSVTQGAALATLKRLRRAHTVHFGGS
jgi:hypothetical protein